MTSPMNTHVLRAAAAVLAIVSLATASLAQERRVRFERGRTGAVLKGTIADGGEVVYVLGANRGQTLIVHVSTTARANDVVFTIDGLMEEIGTDFEGTLPATRDYRIRVGAIESRSAPFTLEVTIR